MKNPIKEQQGKIRTYLNTHKKTRIAVEYITSILVTLFAALLFALTFNVLQSPSVDTHALPLISGGSSGIARIIALAFSMGLRDNSQQLTTLTYSISYAIVNIPIMYIAFRKVSFRFGLFTTINVVATSLLSNYIGQIPGIPELSKQIACVVPVDPSISPDGYVQAGLLTRAFLAGIFSGVASSVSFACGGSSGGVDTIGYYFSMRKSTNIGRYTIIINSVIFAAFATLNVFAQLYGPGESVGLVRIAVANSIVILLFVMIFSVVSATVIDLITRTNKKDQVQIITKVETLPKLLLANIPHGVTVTRAKGAFTGEDHLIIYMTVSTYETPQVIKLVRDNDPHSFINVMSIKQMYGRFRKPKIK